MPLERICGVGVLGRVDDVVMPEMTSKVPSNQPRWGALVVDEELDMFWVVVPNHNSSIQSVPSTRQQQNQGGEEVVILVRIVSLLVG